MKRELRVDRWVNTTTWYVLPMVVFSSYVSRKAINGSRVADLEIGWLCFTINFRLI
jgi:hypothetical protein